MVQVVKVLEGVSEAGIAPIQWFLRHLAEDPAKEIAHQETSSASDHLQIWNNKFYNLLYLTAYFLSS